MIKITTLSYRCEPTSLAKGALRRRIVLSVCAVLVIALIVLACGLLVFGLVMANFPVPDGVGPANPNLRTSTSGAAFEHSATLPSSQATP
jgi:hypothetical protein